MTKHRKKNYTASRTGQGFYQVKEQVDPLEAEKFLNHGELNKSSDISFVRSQQQQEASHRINLNYGNQFVAKTVISSPSPT